MVYEPASAGLDRTRSAVASYYASRGLNVDPDQIVLTASTSEAYSYLFKLLTDPGDAVAAPRPSYPLFEFLTRMDGVRLQHYSLRYEKGWWLDTASLENAISDRTRAILAVNPNNPTGSYLTKSEIGTLLEICGKRSLALIVDEVFSDYAIGPRTHAIPAVETSDKCVVFTLNGLSKVLCLPQMKLGWIVVNGPRQARVEALRRLEIIGDTYLSVSTPVQLAAIGWMQQRNSIQAPVRRRLEDNLAFLQEAVRGSPCDVLDVEGGWYTVLQLPRTRTEEQWVLELLEQDSVLVQPGFFFDFEAEAFIVMSLLTPEPTWREGIRRLILRAG
jgi:alanine-synthesizing transaminase